MKKPKTLVPLRQLLLLLLGSFISCISFAQVQWMYTPTPGSDAEVPIGKSTVSVQETGNPVWNHIFYLQNNLEDCKGFSITKTTQDGIFDDRWRYRSLSQTGPKMNAYSMTLSHDQEHLIVVGSMVTNCDPFNASVDLGNAMFVMKISTSNGFVVWTRRIEETVSWDFIHYQQFVIAKANSPSNSYVIFGAAADIAFPLIKMIGLSIDDMTGNLNWSQTYREHNGLEGWLRQTIPTDVKVEENVAFVVSEQIHTMGGTRIGLFKINTQNGAPIEFNDYRETDEDRFFHPRIELLNDVFGGFAITFNDFAGDPVVARLEFSGPVFWAKRINGAAHCRGVEESLVFPNMVECYIQAPEGSNGLRKTGLIGLMKSTVH